MEKDYFRKRPSKNHLVTVQICSHSLITIPIPPYPRFRSVCLVDIQAELGNTVTKKLQDQFGKSNVLFVKCDIRSDKEFEDAYNACEKQLGKITILCNNAGVFAKDYKTSMDINFVSSFRKIFSYLMIKDDDYRKGMSVLSIVSMIFQLGEPLLGAQTLPLKRMGKHNGGEGGFIVNTASMLGAVRAPFTPMYSATKAAVIHYTRCMGS
ncbi:15-hydroxyprostaglandin dehydrogenase [NAD(+)] [Armadillidium vulgare]|nr:15-hydroxyprostaglandin dehydrogenase [NAD(+)] [Armadillidium vulgare]